MLYDLRSIILQCFQPISRSTVNHNRTARKDTLQAAAVAAPHRRAAFHSSAVAPARHWHTFFAGRCRTRSVSQSLLWATSCHSQWHIKLMFALLPAQALLTFSFGRPQPLSKAEELEGIESWAPKGVAGMSGETAVLSCLCHPSLGGCFQHIWKSL